MGREMFSGSDLASGCSRSELGAGGQCKRRGLPNSWHQGSLSCAETEERHRVAKLGQNEGRKTGQCNPNSEQSRM